MVAGPNGSGKSSLSEWRNEGSLILDPDAIARRMSLLEVKKVALAAGREVLRLRGEYLAAGLSFTVETTLAGNGSLELMRAARVRDFQVSLIYITLDSPERNIQRVKERVAQGGHDIPGVDVRRRFARSLANLPEAVRLADAATLFDNSGAHPELILESREGRVTWITDSPPEWLKGLHFPPPPPA